MNIKLIDGRIAQLEKAASIEKAEESPHIFLYDEDDKRTLEYWYFREIGLDRDYSDLDQKIKAMQERLQERLEAFTFYAEVAGIPLTPEICKERTDAETLCIIQGFRHRTSTGIAFQRGKESFNSILGRVKK
jgi:hypothetical protein